MDPLVLLDKGLGVAIRLLRWNLPRSQMTIYHGGYVSITELIQRPKFLKYGLTEEKLREAIDQDESLNLEIDGDYIRAKKHHRFDVTIYPPRPTES